MAPTKALYPLPLARLPIPTHPPPAPPKKKKTARTAPAPRAGTNYLNPKEHCKVHVALHGVKLWEGGAKAANADFRIWIVPCNSSVRELVERLCEGVGGEKMKKIAVTECVEAGTGKWLKGTTIEYKSDKAMDKLKSLGWSSKRGESLPPVWVCLHKV
ncbi:hypothetical protein LTR28_006472 [Elasticomyces elasticus]|nr:hypothetical protein LTR28_006472 [Elasticomyces elasticus]